MENMDWGEFALDCVGIGVGALLGGIVISIIFNAMEG